MNYDAFLNKWNGKTIDWDGQYGGQCVDLIAQYCAENGKAIAYANAKDWWGNGNLNKDFDFIQNNPNDANQLPKRGDIIIWNGSLPGSGGYGHIAIYDKYNGVGSFTSFDQNWGGQYCHFVDHNWSNVIGWITPKVVAPPAPAPAPSLQPHQRILINAEGVNQRTAPNTGATIINAWAFDANDNTYNFKGFVRGQDPYSNGNNIWFVGALSGGYFYSGAFQGGADTTGLQDLTKALEPTTPAPAPEPPKTLENTNPAPPTFVADTPLVTEVVPSPNYGRVQSDNSVDKNAVQKQQWIVVHQWDDPKKKPTREGVLAHFKDPAVEVSAHYVVDDESITQLVPEDKRAWHAGVSGNDGIGIEFDPNGTDKMYENGRKLIADIRKRKGDLELRRHSAFMPTECPKYIDLEKLEPVAETPVIDYNNNMSNAVIKKGALEFLRLVIFALPGILITIITNNPELGTGYGAPILLLLKSLDRGIHEDKTTTKQGILPF